MMMILPLIPFYFLLNFCVLVLGFAAPSESFISDRNHQNKERKNRGRRKEWNGVGEV